MQPLVASSARSPEIQQNVNMTGGPITVVPANRATWDDLQKILGTRGAATRCQCQRYKLQPGESFANTPLEERAFRLRQQSDCGNAESNETSGLVAYLDGEPVGWCAVEPRVAYAGLLRNSNQTAWQGRDEDRTDRSIWAITCVFTRAGFRREGISGALVSAAVDFARERGASALEGYPMTTTDVLVEELHVGIVNTFASAGFTEVSRPSTRRAVVRIDF